MTETPSLEQRIAALENSTLSAAGSRRWPLVLSIGLLILFCGMIGSQFQLIHEMKTARDESSREHLFWSLCHDSLTPEARTDAFLALVNVGNYEWKSAQLVDLRLADTNLNGSSLREATLDSSDLSGASLVEVDFANSSLQMADLSRANLEAASLDSAILLRARLDEANFRSAQLTGASLEQVTGTDTVFVLADLADSSLLLADLTNADFTGANLAGADLQTAALKGATLALTDFSGANLENVDLTNSNWWRARGITTTQLAEFVVRFAPTADADESRRNDFDLWLKSFSEKNP